MIHIDLSEYGPIIGDALIADKVYCKIYNATLSDEIVEIDMAGIKLMATFCAKQIFGSLYNTLGSSAFYERIKISNATDNIKTTIGIGIEMSLE